MPKHYIAVTYDICEHNDLYEDMNEYTLDSPANMNEQVKSFAEQDIAPLVKVYESDTSDFEELTLYKEYKFKEYECDCEQYHDIQESGANVEQLYNRNSIRNTWIF